MEWSFPRRQAILAVVGVSVILVASFSTGLFVGAKQIEPFYSAGDSTFHLVEPKSDQERAHDARQSSRLTETPQGTPTRPYVDSIPPLANETDPYTLIDIENRTEVQRTREELVQYVWRGDGFPSERRPDQVERNVTYEHKGVTLNNVENLDRIDRLTITMKHGVTADAYYMRPVDANGDLVVFMMGHFGHLMWRKDTIGRFVEAGYTVVGIPMPLSGTNNQPVVNSTEFGTFKLEHHDQFGYLETAEFSPIQYFLEPPAAAVNYAQRHGDYETTAMVGISGGGWTTTLYAAVDPRIERSYPVAGSHPMYLRRLPPTDGDTGDYEQSVPGLYRTANYLELYVLGSVGEGRKQIQILNQYDPCCFAGAAPQTYAPAVERTVDRIGAGEYQLYLDASHRDHQISEEAMAIIHEDIENATTTP